MGGLWARSGPAQGPQSFLGHGAPGGWGLSDSSTFLVAVGSTRSSWALVPAGGSFGPGRAPRPPGRPGNSTWTGKLHLDCLRTRLRRSNRTQAVHRHVGGPSVRRPARPRQWPARAARRFACCDDGPSLGAGASLLVATVRGVGARTDAVPDEPPSPPTTTAHPNRAPPDNPITSASITRQPGGDPQLVPTHPPKHDVSPTTHRWLGRRWS